MRAGKSRHVPKKTFNEGTYSIDIFEAGGISGMDRVRMRTQFCWSRCVFRRVRCSRSGSRCYASSDDEHGDVEIYESSKSMRESRAAALGVPPSTIQSSQGPPTSPAISTITGRSK
jgi:hypothetical protein